MKIIKNTARTLVFFLLLGCLLGSVSPVLQQKDSADRLAPFLADAQEYDVLFLGDSLVRDSIYPLELYSKYGIAAYNLGSGSCSLPLSYWKLMNALDYVTPKLVMLSVAEVEIPDLAPAQSAWMHVALDAFPMSSTKARAILDLTSQGGQDKDGVPYRELAKEMFFPLLKYHSRWSSLESEDWKPVYNTQKGASFRVHVSDPDPAWKLAGPDEYLSEEGYGYAYLRRIIEACRQRDIPIVLYYPPAPLNPEVHMASHTAGRIAAEYGVPMLNFSDMDRVVDFRVDCADPGTHLNPSGSRKVMDYLGDYMTRHYDLPDRREDPGYAHWNDEWNAYVDEKVRIIAEDADSMRARLMLLHDEDFSVVLSVRPDVEYGYGIQDAMQNIARANVYEEDDLVSGKLNPLEGLSDAKDFNRGYLMIVDRDAASEYESVYEFYGIGEREFETSFGTVFCRMDGEWIDTSITQDGEETYYFDSWEEQDEDMHLILIDRRTGKPALTMAFSEEK